MTPPPLLALADELERPLAASEVERGRIARQLREEAKKVERDMETVVKGSFDASAVMAKENAGLRAERDALEASCVELAGSLAHDANELDKTTAERDALQAQVKRMRWAATVADNEKARADALQAKLAIAREAFEKLLGLGDFVEWRIAKEALEQLNKTQSEGKENR